MFNVKEYLEKTIPTVKNNQAIAEAGSKGFADGYNQALQDLYAEQEKQNRLDKQNKIVEVAKEFTKQFHTGERYATQPALETIEQRG